MGISCGYMSCTRLDSLDSLVSRAKVMFRVPLYANVSCLSTGACSPTEYCTTTPFYDTVY